MEKASAADFPHDYFTRGYDRRDPRAYFRSLAPLGYRQPTVVAGFLRRHGAAIAAFRGTARLRVLDFGCGYGTVGGLVKHDVTLDELYDRFAAGAAPDDPAGAPPNDPAADPAADHLPSDRAFFAARRTARPAPEVGGLDVAGNAVAYAEDCGLIDRGFVEDLTQVPPGPEMTAFMAAVDIVVETGAVYAILLDCLSRLLDVAGTGTGTGAVRPWVLCGPRGDSDTRDLWRALRERGYRIEVCSRAPMRYRRFLHDRERAEAERLIRARGDDPGQHLRDGWFVNPLVLARPEAQAADLPIERLTV